MLSAALTFVDDHKTSAESTEGSKAPVEIEMRSEKALVPRISSVLATNSLHRSDDEAGMPSLNYTEEFNRVWARRLLGSNAALLLMTDGLDRDDQGDLAHAAAQLRRLAHQIIWLNPLLRFDGFEPRAAGVRALLPNVDRFLPVHNLASLADLGRALRAPTLSSASLLN